MNTSPFETVPADERSVLVRVLVVAGTLVGFGVLAVLLSGTANASERSPDRPDRPGLLSAAGKPLQSTVKQADSVLRPVTDVVHTASSQVAPVVKPVTDLAEPVLAPVTRPVVTAVAPLLPVVRPVTEPVLRPVLNAVAPVTEPVVHAVGAAPAVKAVAGTTATTPRDDVTPAPASPATVQVLPISHPETAAPAEKPLADQVLSAVAQEQRHPSAQAEHRVADRMSGPDGGGSTPPTPAAPAASGAVSANSAGQHGGEYAVTETGSTVPGTDRAWRAPPGGPPSLYWLVFYGNDHPS